MRNCSSRLVPIAIVGLLLGYGFGIPETVAQSPDCTNPQTQLDMNTCAGLSWQQADAALNQAYQAIAPNLSETRQSALVEAQLKWIEYRDAECQFYSSWAEGGSLQPALEAGCLADVTQERTVDLKAYSHGEYPQAMSENYSSARQQLDEVYQQLQQRLSASRQPKLV
jgi:uncharacterized protein YecT (DUF1311 family)